MAKKKLGICVMGLGIGYLHAKSYSKMGDVDLYICDIDKEKVKRAEAELEVKRAFGTIEEALESPEVDAVDIALPHDMHRDVALRAAEVGKNIMIEKPIARNLKEADEIIKAARRVGIKLMVAEWQRFAPSIVKAREFIKRGLLGKIFLIQVNQLGLFKVGGWRLSRERMGGGNLIDSGIHAVDALLSLGGDVKLVFSQMGRFVLKEMEGEDTSVTVVRFRNGTIGNLITSWGVSTPGPHAYFTVYGTDGSLWEKLGKDGGLYIRSSKLPELGEEPVKVDLPEVSGFEVECRHFVECILQDREPITGPKEARADLEFVIAAYRSAETGMPVRLPLQEAM
ncbi:MAG TPA: Gfo/Idh/MocA family oxidoreductase [Candidatus Latescibacteria bacterium]|nr:Gfo/Idh/MocA family oxidoreductase [Candidatus Latescibacterota bacterium]